MSDNILNFFDTESVSENGAWLHFVHPHTKKPVYLDKEKKKPFRMKFKGPQSDEWVSFIRKNRDSKAKPDYQDEKIKDAKVFTKMLLEWENVPVEGGEPTSKMDKDYAFELFFKHKDLRDQALYHIIAHENFTDLLPKD